MRRVLASVLLLAARSVSAEEYDAPCRHWAAAWKAADLPSVMALYDAEPVFHSSAGERWVGAETLRSNFAAVLEKYRGDLHLHSLRNGASGDLAFDSGSYDETITPVSGGDPALHVAGSYLCLTRRGAGGWKIYEQVWTGALPRNF